MKIRPTQIRAFQAAARASASERVLAYLEREGDPVFLQMEPASRQKLVDHAIVKATDFGFESDWAFAWFAEMFLEVGPRFYLQPVINKVLRTPASSEQMKLSRVTELPSEDDWEDAATL